ncbi:hypothetical protein JHK85_034699 [Glycine max]|nr:hypothetical protein JHK85_034699 [Glycine max]
MRQEDARTLKEDGWKGLKNLGELASGDYPTFGALIWRRELIDLTLLLLTGSESILFGVGSLGIAGAEKCAGLEPEKRHANRGRILAFQKLGGIDGDPVLRGTRIRATWEYVSSVEEWYLEICRRGQETLGTSGGVLLPKTKLDQSRPNPGIGSPLLFCAYSSSPSIIELVENAQRQF